MELLQHAQICSVDYDREAMANIPVTLPQSYVSILSAWPAEYKLYRSKNQATLAPPTHGNRK